MISLVFWATAINYLDRQTLSVVAPVLIDQFKMTNMTYSKVIFAFMLAYTIMNGISGALIDRLFGFDLGARQHGFRRWRDGVRSANWLGD